MSETMRAWPLAAHELVGKTFVTAACSEWLVSSIDPDTDRAVIYSMDSDRVRGVVPLTLILQAARSGEITLE